MRGGERRALQGCAVCSGDHGGLLAVLLCTVAVAPLNTCAAAQPLTLPQPTGAWCLRARSSVLTNSVLAQRMAYMNSTSQPLILPAAYRAVVFEDPQFISYFQKATPQVGLGWLCGQPCAQQRVLLLCCAALRCTAGMRCSCCHALPQQP